MVEYYLCHVIDNVIVKHSHLPRRRNKEIVQTNNHDKEIIKFKQKLNKNKQTAIGSSSVVCMPIPADYKILIIKIQIVRMKKIKKTKKTREKTHQVLLALRLET